MSRYKKPGIIGSFIGITILFIISFFVINVQYQQQVLQYQTQKNAELETRIDATLESYRLFSEYIYTTAISNPEITQIMSDAYLASEEEQAILRAQLLSVVDDTYSVMNDYDFRQLHFHFPDSTSFLRVHRPDTFGDSLYDVRYSIRTVNEQHIFVTGFEEGRIFNGYRYVYPLSHDGEHVGSVEVSVSMSSVMNVLTKLYEMDTCFWIQSELVEDTVFLDEQDNYFVSPITDMYLVDIGTIEDRTSINLFTHDEMDTFMKSFDESIIEHVESNHEFGAFVNYQNTDYLVLFNQIYNIEGEQVAYFISVEVNEQRSVIQHEMMTLRVFSLSIYIGALIILFLLAHQHTKLRLLSNTDRLTNIDNRRKFELDIKQLLRKYKGNHKPISLVMYDIDHFKNINDAKGHDVGDIVLRELTSLIKDNIRQTDLFSRFGGEEFMIVLTGVSEKQAYTKAEYLRKLVEQNTFSIVDKVTISLGVYEIQEDDTDIDELINRVDHAMYYAKEQGRNITRTYSEITIKK